MSNKLLTTTITLALVIAPLIGLAQTSVTNNFYVEPSFDTAGRAKVSATLRYTSERAYFYVEDDYYNSLIITKRTELTEKLNLLGNEFDTRIYPELRDFYGSELNPGIDGDQRVTIFLTRTKNDIAGYTRKADIQPRSVEPTSNAKEMIYLSSDIALSGLAKSYLAHEFTHLIEYNQKNRLREVEEQPWLSEALAEYAPTLLGYNSQYKGSDLENKVEEFLLFPTDSLIKWGGASVDLATVSVFAHFLADNYTPDVLSKIMQSSQVGALAVSGAISDMGYSEIFEEVFVNWTIANYANGTTRYNKDKYSYRDPNLNFSNLRISTPLQYSIFPNSPIGTNLFIDYAAASWLKFVPGQLNTGQNILKVEFDGSQGYAKYSVPYVATDITGRSDVRFMELENNKGTAFVEGFGASVFSVVVIPSNYYISLFDNPPFNNFSIKVSLTYSIEKGNVDYADGSLLRAKGDTKVYVIKKADDGSLYKRWIPSPEIFNGYGHLRWEDIVDVDASVLNEYRESRLIKFSGDYKVYELNQDAAQKQWLDMSPARFEAGGRSWGAIFEVNRNEYEWYQMGKDIQF